MLSLSLHGFYDNFIKRIEKERVHWKKDNGFNFDNLKVIEVKKTDSLLT